MKKSFPQWQLMLICLLFTLTVSAQNDYIVMMNNDSIAGVTVTGYPTKPGISVNYYNERLNKKYMDMRILYTLKGKSENEYYSEVKAFSMNGKRIIPWHARPLTFNADNKIEFSKVLEFPDKTKDQLYAAAKSFFISTYSLSGENIQKYLIEDKENGMLSLQRMVDAFTSEQPYDSPKFSSWITYDLVIRVKDKKCKITINNFSMHYEKGHIFDNKAIDRYDPPMETVAREWRQSNGTVHLHLYKGYLNMFYCAQDKLIQGIEDALNKKDDNW
jgi:hypothetical protein